MPNIGTDLLGKGLSNSDNGVDNTRLVEVNKALREHPVEVIGQKLRGYMKDMKAIV
jgi:ketol-acid reductoisomerase